MKKEDTKKQIAKEMERIALMQAYVDGKQIQYFNRLEGKWEDTTDPRWSQCNSYRIKPEPNYRPFKNAEECWQEMLKHQPFGWIKGKKDEYHTFITVVDNNDEMSLSGNGGWSFIGIMKYYTFADGTPFGIKMEE